MAVLYRDYRPQTFAELINQEYIKTTLKNAVESGSFAHAYLFAGPRGTGKTSAARILARTINCPKQKKGEPCNQCGICKSFLDGTSLDLTEIDAASNTGIENVRDIIEHLRFSPSSAKFKVFIIDEVHMLSKGAFNALLKTLEEPPAHAVFILATTEIHKVPATVISRTQRFDFKKITPEDLLAHLSAVAKKEKIKIDSASLRLIAEASEGSARDALSILDKLSSFYEIDLEKAEQVLGVTNIAASQAFLDLLAAKQPAEAVDYLSSLFEKGTDPVQFNKDFLEYLRKVLVLSIGAEAKFLLDKTHEEILVSHAKSIKPSDLLHIIRLFLKANKDFAISPTTDLPMQIAAAEACLAGSAQTNANQGAAPTRETLKKNYESADSRPDDRTKADTIAKTILELDQSVPKPAQQPIVSEAAEIDLADFPKVNFEQIQNIWPEVLSAMKERAGSLFALMKNVTLAGAENNVIRLSCAYKFHKDSLEQKKNYDLLAGIIGELLKTKVMLAISFNKEQQQEFSTTDNVALEVFGNDLA